MGEALSLRIDGLVSAGASGDVEVVERKGLGHPDTICDALAERLSAALCAFYLERFGTILHHNVDKALLVGGASRPAFGGGEVLEPIEIHLAGRAVTRVGDAQVPVAALAIEHARDWLRSHLRGLDVERHVRIHVHVRPGSVDLAELFGRGATVGVGSAAALANDTSYGVGFAPLSPLERCVLDVERELNSAEHRDRYPEAGEDVKVMASRDGRRISLTVARAFVGRYLRDLGDYQAARERVRAVVARHVAPLADEVEVQVNASDDLARGSVYLTVSGTSAEAGDDGEVGRGNRANGLITPYRPMSLEAVAGKNPVSHVGKIYNLLAREAAEALVAELAGDVLHAEVLLLSRIGHPVREPRLGHVRVALAEPERLAALRPRIAEIVTDQLAAIDELARRVLRGEVSVY